MSFSSLVGAVIFMFPLGKTGGLIEALLPWRGERCGAGGFRWVKPAASLKRRA